MTVSDSQPIKMIEAGSGHTHISRVRLSALRASVPLRLALVAILAVVLWAAIAWAVWS
jgi:hypothetical protein